VKTISETGKGSGAFVRAFAAALAGRQLTKLQLALRFRVENEGHTSCMRPTKQRRRARIAIVMLVQR
jgi:hypothetical protein